MSISLQRHLKIERNYPLNDFRPGLQWPRGRAIAWLGKVSYSLFLVHFPVLVLVATVWTHLEWHSPAQAVAGLGMSFLLSLLAAVLFHRWVEQPASALGHRYRYQKAG